MYTGKIAVCLDTLITQHISLYTMRKMEGGRAQNAQILATRLAFYEHLFLTSIPCPKVRPRIGIPGEDDWKNE